MREALAVIESVEAGGHRYYGQWFQKIDPEVRDVAYKDADVVVSPNTGAVGPVEEFQTPARLMSERTRVVWFESPINPTLRCIDIAAVAAACRARGVISAIDKARPEVIIDVELLEVDRTRLQEYGLQVASPGSPGLDGAITASGSSGSSTGTSTATTNMTLRTLRNLTQSDVLLANLPSLYYRLLKTDSNTRTLANPQLRTSEGLPAQARFGERVPVPVTTFAPIATEPADWPYSVTLDGSPPNRATRGCTTCTISTARCSSGSSTTAARTSPRAA